MSADESAAGSGVRCASCGTDLTVPAARSSARLTPNGRRGASGHDFDAELVSAARTAPARPRKTPRRVETPSAPGAAAETASPGDAPTYDLIGVGTWAERLGPLSLLVLLASLAAAAAVWVLIDAETILRGVVAGALVVFGLITCVALRVLREVCRSVMGLAARQREMAGDVLARGK
jgi:hypothetical protein